MSYKRIEKLCSKSKGGISQLLLLYLYSSWVKIGIRDGWRTVISTKLLLDLMGSPLSKAITNNWQWQKRTLVIIDQKHNIKKGKNAILWLPCKQTCWTNILIFFSVANSLFRDAQHRNRDLQERILQVVCKAPREHVRMYWSTPGDWGESGLWGSTVMVQSQTARCLKWKTKTTQISSKKENIQNKL